VQSPIHSYEIRPRKDKRGVDLVSERLPFGKLWYGEPNAIGNALDFARFFSRAPSRGDLRLRCPGRRD
jgi:hypothetical protein